MTRAQLLQLRQTPKLLEDCEVGFVICELSDAPGAPGIKVARVSILGLSTRKMKKGLEWITFDDIMMIVS